MSERHHLGRPFGTRGSEVQILFLTNCCFRERIRSYSLLENSLGVFVASSPSFKTNLPAEPPSPASLAQAGSYGDTAMGQAQVRCSLTDYGDTTHLRRTPEFQFSSPRLGVRWRFAGIGGSLGYSLVFDEDKLMPMWRFAVITFLREALLAKALTSNLSNVELRTVLRTQYERWWSIDIDHFASKEHFLRYAGRYVRRPPIAQYRFVKITDREVRFWTKDKILKRRVSVSDTPLRRAYHRHGPESTPREKHAATEVFRHFEVSELVLEHTPRLVA